MYVSKNASYDKITRDDKELSEGEHDESRVRVAK